jgi:hypothetical protein
MFSEIPKLASSSDYPRWAKTISAYLGVQKALKVVMRTAPVLLNDKSNQAAVNSWEELEDLA